MIKLLVVTRFNAYEVACIDNKQAYEYMNTIYLNGGYSFYLDFNYPSPDFAYHQVKQRLNEIKRWQESYDKNDIKGVEEGKSMLSKYWKLQNVNPQEELEKIAELEGSELMLA